ncbi:MAG: site-specific DNA-methyltransferase [Defluviicoccus sp.]|nr:site-specific DNA-methyltransferase [Defluviicoccus sp.]MDG4591729.1 site-specific DNA-methyltransferase [Defluviicoccus sp.]
MTSLRFCPEQIELMPIARLKPYANNARTHSDDQVARIAASLVEFGFTSPLLIADDGTVIAGHGRLLAAQRLGLSDVPVIRLQHLTANQARAYRISDNQLALAASWDEDALSAEIHALNGEAYDLGLLGFDDADIDRLLAPLDDDAAPIGEGVDDGSLDETPAPPPDPVSRPGDLWLLGEHRLLCGDATDPAAESQLMAGEQAALLFTSPPYAGQRDYTTGGVGDWDALMRGVFAGLPMRDDGQVLVNLGLVHRDNEWLPYWQGWLDWMRTEGWRRFGLYVWDQGAGMPGDWAGRLAPAFELIFHFNRQARKPNKIVPCKTAGEIGHAPGTAGMRQRDGSFNTWTHGGAATQPFRIPDSVIRIERHHGAVGRDLSHPAPFPVKLAEHVMLAYTDKGEIVYEPFCGSGTSLIAGERTGRKVRAIELAPAYVDVSVLRWQQLFPDKLVTLAGDGRPFAAVAAERRSAREVRDAA